MRAGYSTITLTQLSSSKPSLLLQAHLIAALALLPAACGSKPSPPGPLENVGGSFSNEPDASLPAGSGGGGAGGGGSSGAELDAGLSDADAPDADRLDAGPDARPPEGDAAPGAEDGCLVSSLEARCEDGCPDIDEAPSWLAADAADAVVRRRCQGADGTRYITIGGAFGDASSGYIYAAQSGELVATYVISDSDEWCTDTTPSPLGFHGLVIRDCAAVNPDGITRPCGSGASGPGNGPAPPEECVYPE